MKKLQTESIERAEYLSELSLRYKDEYYPRHRRGHLALNCPHCILDHNRVTPFATKQAFWDHIRSHHAHVQE